VYRLTTHENVPLNSSAATADRHLLRVGVHGSEIVVTASDSDYVMTYHKPATPLSFSLRAFLGRRQARLYDTSNLSDSRLQARQRQNEGVGMDRMTEQPDLNNGKEWSKKDLFSLRNRIEHGRTVAHVATFLMRTEAEVREKAAELGLTLPD
jgi:hypothetical protein